MDNTFPHAKGRNSMSDVYRMLEHFLEAEKSDTASKVDQEKYPKPDWAISQLTRASGLVEDICEHGVGHPNQDWLVRRKFSHPTENHWGVHGCDGCCGT